MPFQNHPGLRGQIRQCRPYPAFLENSSHATCGFVLTISCMVGGGRPSPVIGHGFGAGPPRRDAPGFENGSEGARKAYVGRRRSPGMRRFVVAGDVGHRGARRAARESFSEIVLASPSEFPYSTSLHGGVAQLGERLTGSQEVRGSIPLVSTRALNEAPTQVGAFFHIGTQGQRRHHDPPGRQDRKKLRRARPL